MKKIYDAVVSIGEYEDRQTGKKKQQYRNVGAVLVNDEGRMSLKLELIPASGFNGWINFYEPKPREEKPTAAGTGPQPTGAFNDDIPF